MTDLLTALLVVLTGVYAFLTYRILQANRSTIATMREQISASVRPYVYFDLVPDSVLLEARVRNTGITAAHDLRVVTTPQLLTFVRDVSTPAKISTHPVSFLPPSGEIVEFIGSWDEFRSFCPEKSVRGTLSYADSSGRRYEETFHIDYSARGEMPFIERPDVAEELKHIAEHLADIKRSLAKGVRS